MPLDPRDREDFVHLWSAVGHGLGLAPDLLPRDHADAAATLRAIEARNMQGSSHGRELMQHLLAAMQRHVGFGPRGRCPPS